MRLFVKRDEIEKQRMVKMMRLLSVLGIFIALFFCCEAKAQSLSTKITKIEVDGKTTNKNYKVFFLSNGNWIESVRTTTGFVVPDQLKTEEYLTTLITFGKHKLEFSKIHISNFSVDWIVGVDTKPFSEEFVEPEDAKVTERVYYIQFEGEPGRQLVVTIKKNK